MSRLLFTALAASLIALVASRRCCPGDEVFLAAGRRCSDTSDHVVLNCTKGKYLLNPQDGRDSFTLHENNSLQHGKSIHDVDRHCVTRMLLRNNTLTDVDVAFVCFPDKEHAPTDASSVPSKSFHTLMGVLLLISVAFMTAMLLVYALLPEMRDLADKCLMSAVFNLCIAFLVLAVAQLAGSHLQHDVCLTMAYMLYFWMMAAFFWMNVVSYDMWRTVVCESSAAKQGLYVKYSIYAWGCPLVFLAATLLVEHLPRDLGVDLVRPEFGLSSCWFHDNVSIWYYFYGPIAVLITANVVLFVWTAVNLWRGDSCSRQPQVHTLRFKCLLYAKLFIVMGITWIFELISHLAGNSNTYMWLATDILNALQGLLIFIIAVVCRRRVLRGLSQHRTCGIAWPKSWAAGVDAESHAILADTDVEMTATTCGGTAADKILS